MAKSINLEDILSFNNKSKIVWPSMSYDSDRHTYNGSIIGTDFNIEVYSRLIGLTVLGYPEWKYGIKVYKANGGKLFGTCSFLWKKEDKNSQEVCEKLYHAAENGWENDWF